MRLLPGMTPEIAALLTRGPLYRELVADTLLALERSPVIGMVYADDGAEPSACVVRVGGNLFFGGEVSAECLSYIKTKILTFEIYEKYGVFRCYCPDEAWRGALAALFPENCSRRGKELSLDLRDLNRGKRAPEESDVLAVARKYLAGIEAVSRVPEGNSTYVYRVKAAAGTFYARFLPEDASFAAEVTAHGLMAAAGVRVPRVAAFEHSEIKSGLSMMLTEEIAGVSVEDSWPEGRAPDVLREAGRQLALIHSIPVEGFGWIDRSAHDVLKCQKSCFLEWFDDYLADDLTAMNYYDFTAGERERIRGYMEQARPVLDVPKAALVHGDFDVTHIFHSGGKFSGFIDFGEIRGNNRLFDLAVFAYNDRSPERTAYHHLIGGYREAARLNEADLYAVELMALFILLRFAGKKVETGLREYFYDKMKTHIKRLSFFGT